MKMHPSRVQSRLPAAALLLLATLGCGGPAEAQTPAQAQDWQSITIAAVGDWKKPMHLGLRAEHWTDDAAAPKAVRPPSQCRKWQSMAQHLGETYAGHTLRNTVLKRVCGAPGDARIDDAWDWPWSGLANGRLTPPRKHLEIGAWEIRCGTAGHRRRCAMLHEGPLDIGTPTTMAGPRPAAIVTHFVIDMVAGRESVLWRMFVPTDAAAAPEAIAAGARDQKRAIRYNFGKGEHVERFAACAPNGCMMEANLLRGGVVATRLWDGEDVQLSVTLASGRVIDVVVPALGFRAGLAELVRQRREELRSASRR